MMENYMDYEEKKVLHLENYSYILHTHPKKYKLVMLFTTFYIYRHS